MTDTTDVSLALATEAHPGEKDGYKYTKLGWIPENWEMKAFSEVCDLIHGHQFRTEDFVDPQGEGIKVIKIGNVHEGEVRLDECDKVRLDRIEEFKRYRLNDGDILMSLTGNIGRVARMPATSEVYLQNYRVGKFIPKHVDGDYLVSSLGSPRTTWALEILSNQAAQANFGKQDFDKVFLAIPPLPEQRRIAATLGAWDRAIATVQQLLAAQQQRKQGLMQELLTGRRRFKGFGGKWRECDLGELGQFRTSSVDKKLVDGQQRVRLVNYMDVYNNQRIHSGMPLMEVTAKDSQLQSSSLRRGDILFTPSSETPDDIGHSAVVVEDLDNTLFSYHVMRFRPHDDALDLDYRAYVFNNARILKQFSAKATGSTRYTLSASDFGDTLVSFPTDKAEQRAIARTLMACDSEIESMTNQLDHLTTQKRGLIQQLLTGAVRVKH